MVLSHLGITVPQDKFQETLDFYLAALKPLGYKKMMQPAPGVVGLGHTMVPDFWISAENQKMPAGGASHIAFYGKRT